MAGTKSGIRTRLRIDPDLEDYLLSQSERIIGRKVEDPTDKSLVLNRILYEHKFMLQTAPHLKKEVI